MASLPTVLRDVLGRLGLVGTPSAWPLYRYRLTPEDLQTLGDPVRAAQGRDWRSHEAAAVALYAAHRLCREHRDGPWKWETALGFEPTLAQKEQLIEALTEHWRRPLLYSGRGREVLWSLGREGGLPHHLLVHDEDRLGRVLRAVLRDRERLPKGVSTAELVADYAPRLSPRYRVEGMREVLIELVDAVAELRGQVAGQADPVAALDQRRPGWRYDLPLHFEGEHADKLVRGLLGSPKGESVDNPFCFEARLVKLSGRWRVVRRVAELPAQVTEEGLKRLFGADPPHQARLVAVSARGERFLLAELARVGDGKRFKLRPARAADLPLYDALALQLQGPRGFESTVGEPDGFEGLSAEEPWLFAESGELLGTGSLQRRDPLFFGVWPRDWRSEPAPQDLGSADGGPEAARVWRVEAPTRLHPPGEKEPFELSPGALKAQVTAWQVRGGFEALGGVGTVVLRGRPEVRRRVDEGAWRRSGERVEYARIHQPGEWAALDASVYGVLWLRVRHEGRVVLRRRVLRVPDDFMVELKAGEVRLTCPSRGLRHLADCDRESLEVTCQPLQCRVVVPESVTKPPMLRLRVGLEQVKDFEIEVPNPQMRAAFAGLGGVAVAEPVAVDRLLGLRAEVSSGAGVQRWRVEGRAWRNDGAGQLRVPVTGWIDFGELRAVDGRRRVLDLSELESDLRLLLAQAEVLDAEVELALKPWDNSKAIKTLRVKQYPRALVVVRPEGEARPVPDRIALDRDDETPLRVRVRPIGEPAHPGFEPPKIDGGWDWPEGARQDGAWLVTALEDNATELVPGARPRRVTVRDVAPGSPSPTEGLAAAIAARSNDRPAALKAAFDTLAMDAAHADWTLLDTHLDTLGLWPATTYDVVVQLAKHPQALALAVLRRAWMGKLARLPEAFETLPFAWWQVPAGAWCEAFKRMGVVIDALQKHFSDGSWWLGEWRRLDQAMRGVGGLLIGIGAFVWSRLNPDPGSPAPLGDRLVGTHQGLLRRGTELDWPGLGARGALEALLAKIDLPKEKVGGSLPRVDRSVAGWLNDHRDDLRAAPMIAAWITARGCAEKLSLEQTMALRRARAFDPEWFETAWGLAFPFFFAELEPKR